MLLTLSGILSPQIGRQKATLDLAGMNNTHCMNTRSSALTRGLIQEDLSHERQLNYSNNARLPVAVCGRIIIIIIIIIIKVFI